MPDHHAGASYQTVRLKKGEHESPEEGACVMELASMVGREPFGDRPESVSPVIRDFLRDYNDFLDYRRRQDLAALAADVVDSKSRRSIERRRARIAVEWAESLPGKARIESRLWVRLCLLLGRYATAGAYAAGKASAVGSKDDGDRHQRALELIDRLLAEGHPERRPEPTEPAASSSGSDHPTALSAEPEPARLS